MLARRALRSGRRARDLRHAPLRRDTNAMPKVHETGSAGGGRRRGRGNHVSTTLSEINVVPLVDVMLVLLIIFMVTAPMMQQGLVVNLPQARRATPVTAQ